MAPPVAGTCLPVYSGKIAWQVTPRKITWQRSVPDVPAVTAGVLVGCAEARHFLRELRLPGHGADGWRRQPDAEKPGETKGEGMLAVNRGQAC